MYDFTTKQGFLLTKKRKKKKKGKQPLGLSGALSRRRKATESGGGARFRFCFPRACGFREWKSHPGGLPGPLRLKRWETRGWEHGSGTFRAGFPRRATTGGFPGAASADELAAGAGGKGPGRGLTHRIQPAKEGRAEVGRPPPAAASAPRIRQVGGSWAGGRLGGSLLPRSPPPRVCCLRGRERVLLRLPAPPAPGKGEVAGPGAQPGGGLLAAGAPAWFCRDLVLPCRLYGTGSCRSLPGRFLPEGCSDHIFYLGEPMTGQTEILVWKICCRTQVKQTNPHQLQYITML